MSPLSIPRRVADIAVARFDILNARAAELRASGHPVLSLGQAIPHFGPPSAAIRAARAAMSAPETHVYSSDAGLLPLRETLASHLATRHNVVSVPDEYIVTAGANQAFILALMTLVDAGQHVLLPAPYFANHEMAVRAIGAVPIEVPLREQDGFVVRWHDLEPHVGPQTRAVVICNPSNPTGATADPTETTTIVERLAARGIAVISDETYMDFVYGASHWSVASLDGWRENVVLVSTFSKSFGMAGWRVGYLLADRAITEQAIKIQDALLICAPVLSQIAVHAALRESPDYPRSFHAELMARRSLLEARLASLRGCHWAPTDGGFFAFVRVEDCGDAERLASEILEQAHVVTIPGSIFGRSGEGFLRLSYGAASVPQLNEACDRLDRFFAAR